MSNETSMTFMYSIFVLFGALFMVIGVREYRSGVNLLRVAVETTAVITDVVRDDTRRVYVVFYVDGQEYGGRVNSWDSEMVVGQGVPVFYHPDNPRNFFVGSDHTGSLMFVFLGGLFFSIGIGYFYMRFRRNSSANSLVANGKRIMATFIELRPGNASFNNQSCMNLVCDYHDEATGNIYIFKSEDLWDFPPFDHQQIPLIPVYVDHYDYSKHYVAVDEFFDAIEAQDYINDYSQRVG